MIGKIVEGTIMSVPTVVTNTVIPIIMLIAILVAVYCVLIYVDNLMSATQNISAQECIDNDFMDVEPDEILYAYDKFY